MFNLPAWITIKENPNFPKWKITNFQYISTDDPCNNGSTNVMTVTRDKNGVYQSGIKVWQQWPDGRASEDMKPIRDAVIYCNNPYGASFFQSGDSSFSPERGESGPYSFYAEGNSDLAQGLGLPLRRHVQYIIEWTWFDKPTPPPTEGHWTIGNPKDHNNPDLRWIE